MPHDWFALFSLHFDMIMLSPNVSAILSGIVFIAVHITIFLYAYFEELNREDNFNNQRVFRETLAWARGSARCLNVDLALLLLPICRNLLTLLRAIPFLWRIIPFDKHIKFHKALAYSIVVFTGVHAIAHCINFMRLAESNGRAGSSLYTLKIEWMTWAGLTGQGMTMILFLIVSSAMLMILFWYVHHLAVVFYVLAFLHSYGCLLKTDNGKCYEKTTYKWGMLGLGIYVIELVIRWTRAFQTTLIRKIVKHPSNVLEIQFYKHSMQMQPGQYIFLNVPSIARFEWHPFTLTSCPDEGFHSVHIRTVGDWTKAVSRAFTEHHADMQQGGKMPGGARPLPMIRVDGPFGTPSADVFRHEVAVLVGAGIGITPFASILKHIWFVMKQPGYNLKLNKVFLIWTARDYTAFEWFQDLLHHMEDDDFQHTLHIELYLTGRLDPDSHLHNVILNDSNDRDPITKLRTPTRFGRPNMDEVLERVASLSGVRRPSASLGVQVSKGAGSSGPKDIGVFYVSRI